MPVLPDKEPVPDLYGLAPPEDRYLLDIAAGLDAFTEIAVPVAVTVLTYLAFVFWRHSRSKSSVVMLAGSLLVAIGHVSVLLYWRFAVGAFGPAVVTLSAQRALNAVYLVAISVGLALLLRELKGAARGGDA